MELKEVLKIFLDAIVPVAKEIDKINDAHRLLTHKVEEIKRLQEDNKPAKTEEKESYPSIKELELAIPEMPIGRRDVAIEGLDVFTLYAGDEYVILVYPDFIDIGVDYKEAASLRMSKFIKNTKLWQIEEH
jgi:hypothetical protein